MSTQALLIELFTEELPPQALRRMSEALGQSVVKQLGSLGLADADAPSEVFAAPRHLAVLVQQVRATGESREVTLKGPSVKVGLDAEGKPSMALTKWAEKQGVDIASLSRKGEGKQEHFAGEKTVPGQILASVIDDVLDKAIAALPAPRLMRYQLADGDTTVSFARPVHRLLVLHGEAVLPAAALGLQADRLTEGHRFLSSGPISVESAQAYEQALADAKVTVSFAGRRKLIDQALEAAAKEQSLVLGTTPEVEALRDEVTAIVECPAVYVGSFEERYLEVPAECLILTMQTNQRYFPLFKTNGELSNRFLIVSNMAIADPSRIIEGNERVIKPRLADAEFFYAQDRKVSLASRLPRLESVVYHAKLGSQAERMSRVKALAGHIAGQLGLADADQTHAQRAAELAKADLLTDMVGEFPELQGIMGGYYARNDNEPEAVAQAIREQYQPKFAGDALASSPIGTVLALADKLETVAGLFSIGQLPTGDKDPFALRRHTLGIIRMLIEKPLAIELPELLAACEQVFSLSPETVEQLKVFFYERLIGYLREQGHPAGEIAAVVELRPPLLANVPQRLKAVSEFAALPQAQALSAANKRIGNILRKAQADPGIKLSGQADEAQLLDPAEKSLAQVIGLLNTKVDAAVLAGEYAEAMTMLAEVKEPVDTFFDEVMVMAEDPAVRQNRLLLLNQLHAMMNQVADISRLANA